MVARRGASLAPCVLAAAVAGSWAGAADAKGELPAACAASLDEHELRPRCGQVQFTKCNSIDEVAASLRCPGDCPFLVAPGSVACAYYCVDADGCSYVNPSYRFPNRLTGRCEACPVRGCQRCGTNTTCDECFAGFQWDIHDADCVYSMDVTIRGPAAVVVLALAVLVVWVPSYLAWTRASRGRHFSIKDADNAEEPTGARVCCCVKRSGFHATVLRLARRHHHWCKVRDWHQCPGLSRDEQLPWEQHVRMCRNLHGCYLLGLGLPLYYNFMLFMCLFFVLLLVVHGVYSHVWLDSAIFWKLDSWSSSEADASSCGAINTTVALQYRETIGQGNILELTALYVVGLCAVVAFANYQYRHVRRFTSSNATMHRYAVSVRGYPQDATDEAAVKAQLERDFRQKLGRQVSLAYVSICYNVNPRGSPCFNGELYRLLDRLIVIEDVRRGSYSHEYADTAVEAERVAREAGVCVLDKLNGDPPTGGQQTKFSARLTQAQWLEAATRIVRREIEDLLGPGGSSMSNSGEVIAVFNSAADVEAVIEGKGETLDNTFMAPSLGKVSLEDKTNSITSWTMTPRGQETIRGPGSPATPAISSRAALPRATTGSAAAGGTALARGSATPARLMLPYMPFSVLPAQPEGACAHGQMERPLLEDEAVEKRFLTVSCLRSEPVGVGWEHYGKSRAQRWREALWAVLQVLIFYCVIWSFVLYPAAVYVRDYSTHMNNQPGGIGSKVLGILVGTSNWMICMCIATRITGAGFLRKDREEVLIYCCFIFMCVSNTLLNVVITVVLVHTNQNNATSIDWETRVAEDISAMLFPGSFTPCLMWPLQGFLWPFLEAFLDLRFRKSDDLTVRLAERRLEPLPVGLAWDYQGSLTCPVLGFVVIFYASNGLRWSLLFLALWSLFFYGLQHFNHLRMAKMAYTTSNRLDTAALWSWGLVLGEILAGAAFWGVQVRGWTRWCVPAAFIAGAGLLWLILAKVVQPTRWSLDMVMGGREDTPLHETRERTLFDWANCNPGLVLKSHIVDLQASGVPKLLPFVVGKTHAWKAQDRWEKSGREGVPEPSRRWYEPGELYHRFGLIL